MENEKHFYVIGPNGNIHCEGRILSQEQAIERAEYWAKQEPGCRYYVLEATSVSVVEKPIITKPL